MTSIIDTFQFRRTGIALAFYPRYDDVQLEVQRAPDDGGGDPDVGNAETIAILPPGVFTLTDSLPIDGANRHYRSRHVDGTTTPSDWTDWVVATPTTLPAVLPPIPDDALAQILGIHLSFAADGDVRVNAIGNERVVKGYVTVGVGATPSDPTASVNDGSWTGQAGQAITSVNSSPGDYISVKAVGEDAMGNLGPVLSSQIFLRGHAVFQRFQLIVDRGQSGSDQQFDFTIIDPSLATNGVWFKRKTGAGDFEGSWQTGWDRSTGTPGGDSLWTRGEDVAMDGKHIVGLKLRIGYKDEQNVQRYFMDAWTGDPDEIAHAKITQVTVKEDGTVVFAYQGDEDTVGIYYTVDSSDPANEPDDPDAADTYVAGRKGIVTTAITATHGEMVWVKIAGKNSNNAVATGDDIDEAQKLAVLQPPAFTEVSLLVTDLANNGGFDDTYTVDWSTNAAVNDTDHQIDCVFYREGVRVGESVGNTPSDGQEVWVNTGGGDGAPDLHNALVQIVDKTSGNPIATVTTRPDLSAV
ncbi:hypothetical protein ACGF5M_00800 [Gemmatimonadota bacterium]